MKATGEVMAIADSFEMALMKAVRGAEISVDTLRMSVGKDGRRRALVDCPGRDGRAPFALYELLYRGVTVEALHAVTRIDRWFLEKLRNLVCYEQGDCRLRSDQGGIHPRQTDGVYG